MVSNHVKSIHDDKWKGDILHYTGMGSKGDQSLSFMQNRTQMKGKLLYTYFFGYATLKWRRLIRTLILIPFVGGLISGIVAGPINFFTSNSTSGMVTNYEEDVYIYYCKSDNENKL